MKVSRKIKQRYKGFKKHAITQNHRKKALYKYLFFHSTISFRKEIIHSWIEDLKFYAAKGDAGLVGNIWFGLFEFNESMFVIHFTREEDLFLDIGANLGHYSLLASGIKKATSIAVEPVPKTFAKLNRQVKLNNLQHKVETLQLGLGSKASTLYFSTDKSTMNRVVKENYPNKVQVKISTMDDLLEGRACHVMKIDVEGYEKFVLEGGSTSLQNPALKVVIVEINNSTRFYGGKDQEVVDKLESFNFKPYAYDPLKREIISLTTYNKNQFNTIFIRDFKHVEERVKGSESVKIWGKSI